MLKLILASLALTVGLIHNSIASEIIQLNTKLACGSFDTLNEVLEKYGEIPFVSMTASRMTGNNTIVEIPAVMFVNPNTKTYSFVEKFNDSTYCVVSMGNEVIPSK